MAITAAVPERLEWQALPRTAQLFVVAVIAAGVCAVITSFPREWPPAVMAAALVSASCLTSIWKVNLPIPLSSGSTLSVSYAANVTALLLLGSRCALLVALAGAWAQCTFKVKRSYPPYRTAFSVAAAAITMAVTGAAYTELGGRVAPLDFEAVARPLVGAILAYFVVNTGLVATAIALSTRQSPAKIWREDFLWSVTSFTVAGSAGAGAAVVIARGQHWVAVLTMMPVYLIYRTYSIFIGRLDDERRHVEETRRLHGEAMAALLQARQSERALADENERLGVMLRSIGDGVIATDLDGNVLLINNAAEALTGWRRDEALGQPLTSVFQNVDPDTRKRCVNAIPALAGSGDASGSRRSTVLVARDLTERPIEECAAPLRDGASRTIGMMLAFRDISDALRVQEERARAGRLASLGLLAGGIAHDFNNILLAVMGNISLARATMPQTVGAANALAEAEQACVRARQITWQLLTFSKGGVPVKKTITIARVLEEAASLALRGSSATCAFDLPPDLWPIEADEAQLVQVFTNLLINAQQSMPHGGVVAVRAENLFELMGKSRHALHVEAGPYVRVSITDEGIGIPREHVPRIFDPYFSTKQRGNGLGLATTYSIVKNHGGLISVDSQLGRGTTMELHFPASARGGDDRHAPALVVSSGPGRRRVLVMDDEPTVRTLAANMLEFLGYDAEIVDNGRAAIERFKRAIGNKRPFDAVMLDLVVPGDMGARETIGHLTGIDPAARVVVVSGYAQDAAVASYGDYGFVAAMNKPYTLQELQATLETVITAPTCRIH
jgi:PAS domain S-box-containing protein